MNLVEDSWCMKAQGEQSGEGNNMCNDNVKQYNYVSFVEGKAILKV